MGDFKTTRDLIIIQTILQIVYLADLIIMILIFGLRDVVLEKSLGLRVEVIIQVVFVHLFFTRLTHIYFRHLDGSE